MVGLEGGWPGNRVGIEREREGWQVREREGENRVGIGRERDTKNHCFKDLGERVRRKGVR